jgi:1-deoxy-D-xylulose-5-phosphate reductoisomerase
MGTTDQAQATKRRLSVLGATGTVGKHTCDLIEAHLDRYEVVSLTANRNVHELAVLAKRLAPEFVAVADAACYDELKRHLAGTGVECGAGESAVIEAGARQADWIMASIVGAAGLGPTLAAVRQGTTVALANKECLVSAGAFFMAEALRCGTEILPVDSEHSAVFQALDSTDCKGVEKILLTASGGPFRTWTAEQLKSARVEDALKHPNYAMGAKITIDSATLMNKGLELIEAYHLFDIAADKLGAIIHPQQILHCLVYYCDGSIVAQANLPDMRTPIAYSLGWPKRLVTDYKRADFVTSGPLTFEEPDEARFPALKLAKQAMASGGNAPTVLNAANEVAVEAFLSRRIGFTSIPAVVEQTLASLAGNGPPGPTSLDEVYGVDAAARRSASSAVAALAL